MEVGFLLTLALLFLIGIPLAIVVLFLRTSALQRELEAIRAQFIAVLTAQEPQIKPAEQPPASPVKPPIFTESPMASGAPAATPDAVTGIERPPEVKPVQREYPAWEPPAETAVSRLIDNVIGLIKRYFTEGNLIVRVGVIVLFVGVGFLFKYAYDHSMLPAEYRLIGAGAVGVVLLVLGWRLRNRRLAYALVVQGGGIGVLYLTLFAAYRIFHLLPATPVFVCLVVMVLLSAMLAVLQDARSLAVLGISGGFLAPVLTSTGEGSHIALFSYYAILNISILIIAWFKSWRSLNLIGFVFTFVIGTVWGVTQYRHEHFASTEFFLILFFLFYVAIPLLYARRQPPELKGYVDGSMIFGVPIIAFSLQAGLVYDMEYGLAWSAFALGGFYVALAWLHWLRGGSNLRLLSEVFLSLGVVFATLTIPFALDGEWITTAWALEGAAIVWIGIRQQRRLGIAFALAIQLFAGGGFLLDNAGRHAAWPVLNSVFMGALLVALAGLFSSYLLYRNYAGQRRWEAYCHVPFLVWGLCWWFGNGFAEIDHYAGGNYALSLVIGFTAISVAALGWLEYRYNWLTLKHTVTGLTAAMVFFLWVALDDMIHPFEYGGYIAWAMLFTVFYGLLKQRDAAGQDKLKVVPWLHAIGLWSLMVLLSVEVYWQLGNALDLTGAWLTVSAAVTTLLIINFILHFDKWPVAVHGAAYLRQGLVPPAGYLLVWSLFANFSSDGQVSPLPYIPFINPLDIVQVLVLFTLFKWWRRYRELDQTDLNKMHIAVVLSTVTFIWLSAMLLRSLHHWFGIAYDVDAMWHSLLAQACISVFWTLLGLAVMIVAARRCWRRVWIAAAGLLAVVIIKLFFIDLAGRETLETIFSFIVVGLLLLVVGYFSPLPPKASTLEGE